VKSDPPPGISCKAIGGENYWKTLDEARVNEFENEKEQRVKDLAEMSYEYNTSYPKSVIGNYSKGTVRLAQNGEKKVKFSPIDKSTAKVFHLNMFVKETAKITLDKPRQAETVVCDGKSNYQVTMSSPCGVHNCIGHPATWGGLAADGFKSSGGCSLDKTEEPRVVKNPLRNKEKILSGSEKALQLFFKEPEMKELNPAISKVEDGGWQRIKGVMDSGASESVAHPSMCPQYMVTPSAGSTVGQKYVSASGDVIANLGEQHLSVVTDDGMSSQIRYQSADVSRALNSVSEICDAGGTDGQYVVFSRYGGVIMNLETGRRTPFERVDGIYELGLWVRPPSNEASVFPRPGN
jgi:hypothetical protein